MLGDWISKNPSEYEGLMIEENLKLREHLKWCLDILDKFPMESSHEGFCSPETNCDGTCSDTYYFHNILEEIRKTLN